jgi:hypothetical protein
MRYSSRFFLYAPFLLLLALAGYVMAHWWQTAGALEEKLKSMKGREAIPGVTLDWANVAVSGFPFRLDATFDGFAVKGAGAHGAFAWTADHFAVHALTYGAQKDVFEASGNQHLEWTDAAATAHTLDFLPGSLRASAVRDGRGLSRLDVDIIELAGKTTNIGRAQFHMRRDPDGKSLDLMAEADLAKGDLGAFGKEVKTLRLYQTLSQGQAFAGLLQGRKRAPESHALWLLTGGDVRITQSELNGRKDSLTPQQRDAALTLLSPVY